MENALLSVSDFVAITNQTLEYAYPAVSVEGEVAEYRVSQGKWVSFKLKDDGAVVNCFMGIYQLRQPIQDGMKIIVVAAPRLNPKGYFNLNVRSLKPVGEGSIKKGFELLKAKFEAEGLFAPERKRPLPRIPQRIAIVTSTESAAYADFCRIINERWGGLTIDVAHTQVQGEPAADQMMKAIDYFHQQATLADVLVIIRGGGSAEDLSTFNDEPLARAIAASRIPTLVGVGHEVDHTLADMVADVRAATPTHAAEIIVPDRQSIIDAVQQQVVSAGHTIGRSIDTYQETVRRQVMEAFGAIERQVEERVQQVASLRQVLTAFDPRAVLSRGYALVRGDMKPGETITIETKAVTATAEVTHVKNN